MASLPEDGVVILAAAFEACAPGPEARRIGEQLVALAPEHPVEAMGALLGGWDRVAPSVRALVGELEVRVWDDALRETTLDGAWGETVCDAMRSVGVVGLLPLAGRGLGASDRATVDAAGAAVLSLARAFGASAVGGEAGAHVLGGVFEAAGSYDEHRQREALLAMAHSMGTPARCSAVRRWLGGVDQSVAMSLRSAVRRARDASVARGAFLWLTVPALTSTARSMLSEGTVEASTVVGWSHLVSHPVRRRALRGGLDGAIVSWLDGNEIVDERVVRLASLSADRSVRMRVATAAFGGPAAARFAVARGVLGHEAASSLREDLAFDRCGAVARTAARRVQRSGGHALLSRLDRSEHAFVRGMARRSGGARAAVSARLADRRALESDRIGAVGALRGAAASGSVRSRVDAMARAQALGVTDDVELELLVALSDRGASSSGDDAAVIASAAVRTLGTGTTAPGLSAIRACLHAPDARVRANALEALAQRTRRASGEERLADLERIRRAMGDSHHRVRSTAALLVARLAPSDRADVLAVSAVVQELLSDERTLHRVAGLWLAERLSVGHPALSANGAAAQVAEHVTELARAEPMEAVRARASRCEALMVRVVRSGWASRAPAVGAEGA